MTNPKQIQFLEWLLTAPGEREPSSQAKLATEVLHVSERTLRDWKSQAAFVAEWDRRAVAVAGSPERTQRIMDALAAVAVNPEDPKMVQAGKLWADMAGVIRPKRTDAGVDRSKLLGMTQEQLKALYAELAADVKVEQA